MIYFPEAGMLKWLWCSLFHRKRWVFLNVCGGSGEYEKWSCTYCHVERYRRRRCEEGRW